MDAPDPQEAESGRERQRLVQFSIFWSQMVAFGYVPLLDYAGLKNLNVWSLRTPLEDSCYLTFKQMVVGHRHFCSARYTPGT